MSHETAERTVRMDEKRRRLLGCVDQVLNRLGPDVRRALAYYMRRKYSLKHYEIPDKPREFSLALHHVFGRSASGMEHDMAELVVEEFHLGPERKLTFEKAVQAAISSTT